MNCSHSIASGARGGGHSKSPPDIGRRLKMNAGTRLHDTDLNA